ncbi:uncharacterized protein LOC107607491 [Arachis ipaensis]|uniref:uncharacterized protein LOC107607491 n=1 Tax=Arachis ipaensis TaxID=130454 RepID=UPI0007AFC00C|nr:uncharacterized protein LOC107607491 [Arachis ipaensis]
MTQSQPNSSLAEFDPEIERTLLHTRQATRRLDYTASDLESTTPYSSVGTTDTSLYTTGENHMAEPHRITLHEQGAPDLILQPLQARYLNLDPNFELKNSLINLLPKYHGLPGQVPIRHLRDFQVDCSTVRRHGADEIAIYYFTGGLCPADKRLLIASSSGSFSKNKTAAEAWSFINNVAEAIQHVKVRNNPPKSVVEAPPSESVLTKVLGDMTTLLTEIRKEQKAIQSIQAIQAPPQILQHEGPPRVCGLCSSTACYTDQCHQVQEDYTLAVANVNYNNRPPYQSQGQNNYSHGNSSNQGWRDNSQGNNHNNNQSSSQYHNNTNQNHHNQPYQHSQQNQNNNHRYQTPHQRQQTNQPSSSSINQCDDSDRALYQEQERLRIMVEKNEENTRNINAQLGNMSAQTSNITEMLSRMSLPPTNNTNTNQVSSSSNLPSQLLPNPKGSINAITLRSGTTLEEVEPKPIKLAEDVPKVEVGETMEIDEDEKEEEVAKEEEEQLRAKEPFPTVAKKAKKHEELDPNIVQIFKNVEVTIPLFDAIHQVPKYAKFLKDVCTHKEKIGGLGMNLLGNSVSSVMDDFPEKYSDPGPCLVSCMIGKIQLKDCMCDFGSCVSIMPFSIYEKLNLTPLRQSGARFMLADKIIISVVGIAENVLVRILDLIFLVDFYILETPPIDSDRPSSILLGRPFLKTSRFKLDLFFRDYSFEAKGKVVKFKLEETMKQPLEVHSIFGCHIFEDDVIEEHLGSNDEISVNRNLGIKGVSKEKGKDP